MVLERGLSSSASTPQAGTGKQTGGFKEERRLGKDRKGTE